MKTQKPRILILGDAVATTGFAKVIYEIFFPLKDEYELFQLGTNYFGDPHEWPWKIFPANTRGYSTGEQRLADLVKGIKPDLVFMLQDPWVQIKYLEIMKHFPNIPTVVYASFNSGNIEASLPAKLQTANRFVVYTEFAKTALKEALSSHDSISFPTIEVIPHGVDSVTFSPLALDRTIAKKIARKQLYPDENHALQNGFIVLNANRNQPRKRIDTTMEGFHLFSKDKKDETFLHLHMGLKDIGWDIQNLAKRYQLEDQLVFSTESPKAPKFTEATLNTIFNAADVGINTTSSEGWGLLSFEQAAAGLAQVVPNHTSGKELWNESACLLEPSITLVNPQTSINEHIIHPEMVAETLEKLWNDMNYLKRVEDACYKNALQTKYDWKGISNRWKTIFEEELKTVELVASC